MIGTGSSAIQAIPVIAEQAKRLTVFHRTPNFSIPSRNAPMDDAYERSWKSQYPALRAKARTMRAGIIYDLNPQSALALSDEERLATYEQRWQQGGIAFVLTAPGVPREPSARSRPRRGRDRA